MSYQVFEYLKKIEKRIEKFQHWQKSSFVACCAETDLPLVKSFGENTTIQFYETALDRIWKSTLSLFSNTTNELNQLLEDLDFLPESYEDDSNSKSYRVMKALGTMYHALNTVKIDSLKDARLVSNSSQSNKSSIEFVVSNAEGYLQTIKQNDSAIPMTIWDKKEIDFQENIIDTIENQPTPSQEFTEILKVKSREYAAEFAVEVKKYGERMNFF